jgi:hypothetical protein
MKQVELKRLVLSEGKLDEICTLSEESCRTYCAEGRDFKFQIYSFPQEELECVIFNL